MLYSDICLTDKYYGILLYNVLIYACVIAQEIYRC